MFTEGVAAFLASHEDLDALEAYRGAERQWAGKKGKDGGGKVNGGAQTLNGLYRETGLRNRRYRCDSGYHLAPGCPRCDTPRGDGSLSPQERDRAHRSSYSSISTETLAPAQKAGHIGGGETGSTRDQSFAAPIDMGDLFLVSQADSVAVLDTGATANLVRASWLARHNRIVEGYGIPRAPTYPSTARFVIGDGRLGEVSHAADIPGGIAGNKGKCAAFALDADIPALLRKGAMEALGGQLDCSRGSWVLRRHGGGDT